MAGKLVHFELPASDASRAKGFWSGVFGWEFGDSAMPDMEYSMVRTGEDQGGAVMSSEGPFGIVVYFDTESARRSRGRPACAGREARGVTTLVVNHHKRPRAGGRGLRGK